MTDCLIGLGANLGDPPAALQAAVEEIAVFPRSRWIAASSVYRSAPVGPPGQSDYLNACVHIDTNLAPLAVLDRLQALESRAGRIREQRWGPRSLDLDLLLYGDSVVDTARLILPHPRIGDRNFVLRPLAELLGDAFHIGGRPLGELLAAAPDNRLEITELTLAPGRALTA